MVGFKNEELLTILGALESYWGSYESWEQEADDETKNQYKKYHDDAVRIYKKINQELDLRKEKKFKNLEKMVKEHNKKI